MAENRAWIQFFPNTSRVDYLSGMIYNLAYCQAVEKMASIEVAERARVIRVIVSELNRIQSHLLWLGTFLLDIGGSPRSCTASMTGRRSSLSSTG